MVQSIDPAMTSLTKNGGRSIQHFCCCWLLPGGDPICMLYVCQPASSHVEMCRISWLSISYHVLFYWLRTRCLIRLSSGIHIPSIAHLNSDELERMLCWKSYVNTSPSAQVWLHMWPVDSVPFHLRQIFPGRPCLGGQGYSCLVSCVRNVII